MSREPKPIGKPLGWGALGRLLYQELDEGQEASVLNMANPHNGHVDAIRYQRSKDDGQIYPMKKVHLNPTTLDEKK